MSLVRGLPVSQYSPPECSHFSLPMPTERRMVNLSAHCASRGIRSQNSMPGTFVLPCFSSLPNGGGVSGFMSNMSWCGGPPASQIRIICFAFGPGLPAAAARARKKSAIDMPNSAGAADAEEVAAVG